MATRNLCLGFAILSIAASLNAAELVKTNTPHAIAWLGHDAGSVPTGAVVRLEFVRPEFFLGENVVFHFILENTGPQEFSCSTGGDYRGASRSLRFQVTATDETGHMVEDPDPDQFCMGGIGGARKLKPGENSSFDLALARYCDIVQPGRYTIRAKHDFGWTEAERKWPVGEAVVKFRLPTTAEAEHILTDLEQQPPDKANYGCLRQPVFLESLLRRARAGNPRALEGIGSIPTPAATAALIELASAADTNLALTAALTLNRRLPDPEFTGQLPGRSCFRTNALKSRQRLAAQAWEPKFAGAVRAVADKFLARGDARAIDCGAFMIEAVGTTNEAPAVLAALNRTLESLVNPRREPKDNILNDPQPVPELRRALLSLQMRGFALGKGLSGQAQFFAYFTMLEGAPLPRPADWLQLLEVFGDNCRYPVREAAVRSIPQPVSAECFPFIRQRLTDQDLGVSRVACDWAGKSGQREFLKPLLEIIATENHKWLVAQACQAAFELGGGFDLLTTCADRLSDEHLQSVALDCLQSVLEGLPGSSSGRTDLTRAERLALRRHWQEFLAAHAAELRQGKKFKIGDPAVKPELFGRAKAWQMPDGRYWPMSSSEQAKPLQ